MEHLKELHTSSFSSRPSPSMEGSPCPPILRLKHFVERQFLCCKTLMTFILCAAVANSLLHQLHICSTAPKSPSDQHSGALLVLSAVTNTVSAVLGFSGRVMHFSATLHSPTLHQYMRCCLLVQFILSRSWLDFQLKHGHALGLGLTSLCMHAGQLS